MTDLQQATAPLAGAVAGRRAPARPVTVLLTAVAYFMVALDALVVAGQRRRQGAPHVATRSHRRRGHRRRGDHAHLRSSRQRGALRGVPVADLDGDARAHDP